MCGSDEVKRMIIPPLVAQDVVRKMKTIYLRKCPCRASKGLCPPETWEVCLLFEDASQEDLLEAHPM